MRKLTRRTTSFALCLLCLCACRETAACIDGKLDTMCRE
jgi:hypothetical protein